MAFAEQCVFVRTKLLLAQDKLAKELGVSVVTLSRWETQDRNPLVIQYEKILSFCKKPKLNLIQRRVKLYEVKSI